MVLFGGSYEGVAIPITSVNAETVRAKLDELRLCLDSERLGVPTAVPSSLQVCSQCPLGEPRVLTNADRKAEALGHRLHIISGPDGLDYHSACGDRFRWVPPHESAAAKRLIR